VVPPAPSGDSPYEQELIQTLRRALRSGHPLDWLVTVSGLMAVTDRRGVDLRQQEPSPSPAFDELVESFVGVDIAETTAVLTTIAAITDDELRAARIGKLLASRTQPMPRWLTELDRTEVTGVVTTKHVLGDGEDYFIEARLPEGGPLTAVVYVDHNMGTIVKDAFVVAEPLEAVRAIYDEKIADPDTVWADTDRAESRAIIEDAVAQTDRTLGAPETATWPLCRPLVEWLVRRLPPGGAAPQPRQWSERELAELVDDFFASPVGRSLDNVEARSLMEDIAWFGSGWAGGDPMRWSAVNVEILLDDWIPRKVVAEPSLLTRAPDVLRGFIRYCHAARGIRPALTQETLEAVDRWEPSFQQQIRDPARLQGAEALAAMLLDHELDHDPRRGPEADRAPSKQILLESLARTVGGAEALASLEVDPLPDEEFSWEGLPDDIRPRVAEVLALVDKFEDELFDVEHRTAARRFLSRAAAGDPAIFRRQGATNRAAAAVCWAIGRANDTVAGRAPGAIASKDLQSWFGVSGSISQRAEVFLKAVGVNPYDQYGAVWLGTPDLLVGACRAGIVEARDRFEAWDDDF
jgi:Domain of unknown function (DUF6398)